MESKPDIAIIGPGKVGTAMGVMAARAGYRVAAVAGRSASSARASADRIGRGVAAVSPAEAAGAGELVLLTVPDAAIAPVCRDLAERRAFRSGSVVAHCCGALGSEVLSPARDRGCSVGSMHPLQTFPTVEAAVARLPETWFFVEGDEPAVKVLKELGRSISGKAVRIAASAKPLYHAAAVMACNYLAALVDAATALAVQAGVAPAEAWPAMEPLVRATLDNVAALGPAEALTGPIERGDLATVAGHLRAMADGPPELTDFYRAAGLWTVRLARQKGTIDPEAAEALRKLLHNPQDKGATDGRKDH